MRWEAQIYNERETSSERGSNKIVTQLDEDEEKPGSHPMHQCAGAEVEAPPAPRSQFYRNYYPVSVRERHWHWDSPPWSTWSNSFNPILFFQNCWLYWGLWKNPCYDLNIRIRLTTLETIFHGERLQRDKVSVDTVSTAVASLPLSQPELGLMSVSPLHSICSSNSSDI